MSSDEHLKVRVKKGSGRSNLSLWYSQESGNVAAHEFGHLIGHPDEYTDIQCPYRNPVNTGTVMDNVMGSVVLSLCKRYCEHLGKKIVWHT